MSDDFESEARERAAEAAREGDTEAARAYIEAAEHADDSPGASAAGGGGLAVFLLVVGVAAVSLFVAAAGSVFAGVVAAPWYVPFRLAFPAVDPLGTAYRESVLWVHFWTGVGLLAWLLVGLFSARTAPLASVYHGRVDALDGLVLGATVGTSVGSFALFAATGPLGVLLPVGRATPLVGGAAVACSLAGRALARAVDPGRIARSRLLAPWRSVLLWGVTLTVASLYANAVLDGLVDAPHSLGSGGPVTALAVVAAGLVPGLAVLLPEPCARVARDGLAVVGLANLVPSTLPEAAFLVAFVGAVAVLTADLRVRYRGPESALAGVTTLWGRTAA